MFELVQDSEPQCKEAYPIPTLAVTLQPEEHELIIPRHKAKTVKRLFVALGLRECTALVVRDGQLLTPDRRLYANDVVLVRKVTSSG